MNTTPTPATLLLARHGQTVWHAENRYAGVSDVSLTDTGREQAEALGRWAAAHPVDAVWTSPVSRAVVTAEPACRALGLTPHREPGLRECDFGVVEGRTLAEFAAEDPAGAAAYRADPVAHPFPGAEDPKAAAARGAEALRRIAAAHPGERVLVVAHNTLFRLVLCTLLSIPAGEYRRVFPRLLNAAISELRVTPDGSAALLSLNVPCEPGIS
ncbi:histidine phosphatase family protein [Streptomyces resistomycificus]|uniref:Phosphoglycerate mutase n=1 Tax=Streptomyces resistomycificus TaxID=67356 RepID=A0A0L8L2D3_9ACTN|nr:histidine phosphatase family protein [Streptomyces resistomycificus]KOG32408.1 phosphoglycerate mutase [Streptomyces resistomycificus]KUN91088.1 phosphoglycerate mutase [Streptomyces resistomycificus]